MSNYNLDQTKLFYFQILLSFCLIISILISITLSYNEVLKLNGKTPLYSSKEERNILVFNRIFSTLIAVGFLFINIIEWKTSNETCKGNSSIQLEASLLNLAGSLLVLYTAFNENINEDELNNPEL